MDLNELMEWINEWMNKWIGIYEWNVWINGSECIYGMYQWMYSWNESMNEWNESMNEWNESMNEWINELGYMNGMYG